MENLEKLISTSSSEDVKNVLKHQYKLLMKKQRNSFISSTNMQYKETPSDLKKFAMNNLAFGDECWISTYKNEIIDSLNKYQIIIIKGESGYGKSTRIPLYVHEINEFCQGKIASCQPYNVNILSLSSYMSTYYKNKLNLEIGYVLGKENTVNNETHIVFTSCQRLLQECIHTPYLSKYFCIIIDEYFLQSADADLLLLHVKEIVQQRPDFKLILINPAFDITDCKCYFKDKEDVITMILLPSLTFPVKTVYNTISDKSKCVEKCAQLIKFINNNKLDGNILIFLPSTKEMESCREMVKNALKDRVEYHILHNMMNQEEIFNLYAFSNIRRKVIFANQCAESLWLPNISYVIDSGKLKENKYQSEKESYISKLNSERRKNLVGWSLKNCCYRIYTSDTLEEMLEMPIPDILKIEPSQLLLTLYRYKIPNPIYATFISLPGNEHIKAGLNKLIKNKVIKSNSLTTLGEDMINYMPMQTSHAKLIALGRERGIEFEAVMIHIISSLKNPIFMTIGESKDIGKLKFFHQYGDYFAVFNVYFNWIKQVNKERWCEENGINHTAVTYLHGKIDDTCKVFGIKPKEILSNLDAVYELICECFIDNFCSYSGHSTLGYQSLETGKILHIHHSSVLFHKTAIPEKSVVFSNIIEHGKNNYMINVTPLSDCLLEKLIQKDLIKEEVKQTKKLISSEIPSLGTILLKEFLLKDRKHLESLENKIKTHLRCDTVIIDACVESDSILVYTYPEYINEASSFLSDYLKEFSMKLRSKEEIMTMQLGHLSMSVKMAKGAVIKDINFLAIKSNEEDTVSEEPENDFSFRYQYSINLSWQRRHCRGEGFVTFYSPEDFAAAQTYLSSNPIVVDGVNVKVSTSRKEKNQFYIKGLSSKTTNESLKESVEKSLSAKIKVKEASIVLAQEFTTTSDEIELIRQNLFLQFICYIKGNLEVEVAVPNSSDIKMRAYLNFDNEEDLSLVLDVIKTDNIQFQDLTLNAIPVYRMTVICASDQYKCIKSNIKYLENRLKLKESWTSDTVFLILLSNDFMMMKEAEILITTELKGKLLEDLSLGHSRKLFSHSGRQWLKQASKATETFIIQNSKHKTIRICGTTENYEKIKLKIYNYLKNIENEVISVININHGDILNRSVIKGLIQEYGITCKGFLEQFQLTSIELNIQFGQLTLCGMPKCIIDAVEHLKGISCSSISFIAESNSCPVCFMVPVPGLNYRLEYCGHQYCSDCIKSLILQRIIPLTCCKENCGKELVIDDIQNILGNNEDEMRKLLDFSLREYVEQNNNKIRFCPGADCKMIYNIPSINQNTTWTCPLCSITICSLCGCKVHSGMSCKMAEEIRKDCDYSLKVWMKQDSRNRKICTACHSPIQKNGGCNHIVCLKCHSHMCWLCLQIFPDGNLVYNHLPICSRNQRPFV
ncbi:uncharacterized protein [Centruroides vittatus]|uniref:uncharacterized protein n=1 Tax=Centruroides vittatus TaxID=120091 RepID=UPI00350F8E32